MQTSGHYGIYTCTCAGRGHALCLCGCGYEESFSGNQSSQRASPDYAELRDRLGCSAAPWSQKLPSALLLRFGEEQSPPAHRGNPPEGQAALQRRPGQSCSLKQADLPEVGHDFPNHVKQRFGAEGGLTSLPQSTQGLPEFFHQGTAEGKQYLFLERKQALNEPSPYISGQLTTEGLFLPYIFLSLHSVMSDSQRLL